MIFDSNIDWVQLARYLAGESPPEEKAVIEARIDSDPNFCEAFEQAKDVWQTTGIPSVGVNRRKAWEAINREVQQQERPEDTLRLLKRDRSPTKSSASRNAKHRTSNWTFVSVLIILLMAGLYWMKDPAPPVQEQPELAVFKTTAGQRASITLPDGSEAMLNAASQIKVLTGIADPVRIIELDGEAFFSVISDSSKPFIVRAGDAEVRVVGTSFNVSAYPEQQDVHVLVTEGEVKLSKNGMQADDVTLQKNDLGVLPAEGMPSRSRVVSVEKMLAWRQGTLVFEHASFEEVARTMERWFDLEIQMTDPEIANRHLSTSFEMPTPNQVITIIASTLSLDYTIEDNIVTFSIPER